MYFAGSNVVRLLRAVQRPVFRFAAGAHERGFNLRNSDGSGSKEVLFWNRLSGRYDGFMRHFAREYPELLRLIAEELPPDASVLEMACGTGIISLSVSPRVRQVTATDLSPAMIDVARGKARKQGLANISFSVQDGYALDFPDESFDVIIIANALHVVPEPERMLKEAARVLKVRGKLLAATYCHGENAKTRFLFRLLKLTGFRPFREYTSRSFAELIAASGFVVEKTRLLHTHFPLMYVAARGA